MTLRFSRPFIKDYDTLTPPVRKKVDKALRLLGHDLQHPSLRVRKMVNQPAYYEARVDVHYRMTFEKQQEVLFMRRVGTHEIYRKP